MIEKKPTDATSVAHQHRMLVHSRERSLLIAYSATTSAQQLVASILKTHMLFIAERPPPYIGLNPPNLFGFDVHRFPVTQMAM